MAAIRKESPAVALHPGSEPAVFRADRRQALPPVDFVEVAGLAGERCKVLALRDRSK